MQMPTLLQDLIQQLDRRAFYGMAAAAVIGLGLGGAMKPVLFTGGGPEGPQSLGPQSGARNYDEADGGLSFAAYRYGVPEYVIGTDWTRPRDASPPSTDWERAPPLEYPESAPSVDASAQPAAYHAPAPEPESAPEPNYPSMGGEVVARLDVPPPPAPPAAEEPAEASGAPEPVDASAALTP